MIKTTRISFGGTAAIVTSMALIVGLDAANAGRAAMVSALLIAAVADNLTDSLSVHMYQESERHPAAVTLILVVTPLPPSLARSMHVIIEAKPDEMPSDEQGR
jgi:hypothetical protein